MHKILQDTSKLQAGVVSSHPQKIEFMLIIEVKDSENIDRALKRYKRKVQQTKILREVRNRKEFRKPSVERRTQILKAVYKEKKGRDLGL
jgi:small subunit ribosomal protein S21